ncbi:MAG TPA: response regulator transcription factor [Bacteroides sp.]|nr:response regulator transcription factor [Bacteroides sp.]
MKKKSKANILLVEDDKNLAFVLIDYLSMSGYGVQHAEDGVAGLELFKNGKYDICILDVMMPLKDGFTLAEEIRVINEVVPIMFLTAKTMKEDKIKGFKIGGDDYITKPFSTEELSLRIEAILRRTRYSLLDGEQESIYKLGNYTFDYSSQLLKGPVEEKRLTKKEAEVLRLLCINMNKILRREIALKMIWGEDDYFMGRSMDVYITKLRKFLADDPKVNITNIHRTGFMLEVNE